MGKLRITSNGFRLEGEAQFLKALYAAEIRAQKVRVYMDNFISLDLNSLRRGDGEELM